MPRYRFFRTLRGLPAPLVLGIPFAFLALLGCGKDPTPTRRIIVIDKEPHTFKLLTPSPSAPQPDPDCVPPKGAQSLQGKCGTSTQEYYFTHITAARTLHGNNEITNIVINDHDPGSGKLLPGKWLKAHLDFSRKPIRPGTCLPNSYEILDDAVVEESDMEYGVHSEEKELAKVFVEKPAPKTRELKEDDKPVSLSSKFKGSVQDPPKEGVPGKEFTFNFSFKSSIVPREKRFILEVDNRNSSEYRVKIPALTAHIKQLKRLVDVGESLKAVTDGVFVIRPELRTSYDFTAKVSKYSASPVELEILTKGNEPVVTGQISLYLPEP